jgi:hypothetical protein
VADVDVESVADAVVESVDVESVDEIASVVDIASVDAVLVVDVPVKPATSLDSVTKSSCAAAISPERRSFPSCLKSFKN